MQHSMALLINPLIHQKHSVFIRIAESYIGTVADSYLCGLYDVVP